MVAVPVLTAVARPLLLTVATFVLLEVQAAMLVNPITFRLKVLLLKSLLCYGHRYRVAGGAASGSAAGGSGGARSDDRSSCLHARRQPIAAAADTAADRSDGRVRRLPGYGVCNIRIRARISISVGVELLGLVWRPLNRKIPLEGADTPLCRSNCYGVHVSARDFDCGSRGDALIADSHGCGAIADSCDQSALRDRGYGVIRT